MPCSPVSWGCRIHWLHLCYGVRPPPTTVLDMTLNNLLARPWRFGECRVPLHGPCFQVHSDPEWYHLIRIISMALIGQTVCKQMSYVKYWLLYSNTWNHLTVCKRKLCIKCVYKSYIYSIYTYKQDLALNNRQWLICHKTQPNQIIYIWYICIKRIWHQITYNGWNAIKPN